MFNELVVVIPELLMFCAVKFVTLVTPNVLIPEELIFVKVALVLVKVVTIPVTMLALLKLPVS